MRALKAMIRKEFIHMRRDPQLIRFVLGIPVLLLLLFGYALRLRVDNLTAAVWDQDQNFFSVQVKDRLQRDGTLRVVEVSSEKAIRDMLRSGQARLGLIIPKGFARQLNDHKQTTFPLFVDGTMPTLAQAAMQAVGTLTSDNATDALLVDDPENPAPPPRPAPIKIDQVVLFNPDLRDSDFFLPGTIGIVIMLVVLTLSAGLVREKEQQTIEQLVATPIPRSALIAGKMIPYAIVAAVDFVVVAAVARFVFALPFRGSWLALALLAACFIVALLALGSLISTVSETQIQASFLGVFVLVPSVLMSGFVFPIEAMPRWLQPVAWSLPMTYFVDGVRALTLKAAPITELKRDFLALIAFMIVFSALSLAGFRKQLT